MRYLLDTHVLLWLLASDHRVTDETRATLADPRNDVFVSAASAWEIAIKVALRKLDVRPNVDSWLPDGMNASRLTSLPISLNHALGVERLPLHHTDPFDRLLIAQAVAEDMIVATADAQFERYDVRVLRC